MSWAKFFNVRPTKIITTINQRVSHLCESYTNLENPVVGREMYNLQRRTMLARIDGQNLHSLFEKRGFQPRVSKEEIHQLRYSDIENYQRLNLNPFGWGACRSVNDLKYFIESNKAHIQDKWLYKMYGKAASLGALKTAMSMESDGNDSEKEVIILEHLPTDQFLAAVQPKYQEKFLMGGLVPNAMHEYNNDLPQFVRINDICDETATLNWLLVNDAPDAFHAVCKALYANASEEALKIRLGDEALIDAVNSSITESTKLQM